MVGEFRDRKGNVVLKPEDRIVKDRLSIYGIAKQENKILLVQPAWKDEFDLPGGGVEKDEDIYEGLKREFLEETGFSIKIPNKKPIQTEMTRFYADDINMYFHSKLLFFSVEIIGKGNALLINREEIRGYTWLHLDTIENQPINILHMKAIAELKKHM